MYSVFRSKVQWMPCSCLWVWKRMNREGLAAMHFSQLLTCSPSQLKDHLRIESYDELCDCVRLWVWNEVWGPVLLSNFLSESFCDSHWKIEGCLLSSSFRTIWTLPCRALESAARAIGFTVLETPAGQERSDFYTSKAHHSIEACQS